MHVVSFDPAVPLIATSAFPDGTVAAGESFDWRARGMAEIDVVALFRSGLVVHAPAPTRDPVVFKTPAAPQHQQHRRR